MATKDIPILGASTAPDSSGSVYQAPIEVEAVMTAANLYSLGMVMKFPTGSDLGFYGKFNIPQDYVGTPVLVIRGILNGTPANVLAFGIKCTPGIADNETADVAYEAEDLASNSTWTGYADEEIYEETITLTPASAYAAGDEVFYYFYRDDSVDTTTFDFICTGLFFRYNDA